MTKKYKLISKFDGNDAIEFEAEPEKAETEALDMLGYFLVINKDEEESEDE